METFPLPEASPSSPPPKKPLLPRQRRASPEIPEGSQTLPGEVAPGVVVGSSSSSSSRMVRLPPTSLDDPMCVVSLDEPVIDCSWEGPLAYPPMTGPEVLTGERVPLPSLSPPEITALVSAPDGSSETRTLVDGTWEDAPSYRSEQKGIQISELQTLVTSANETVVGEGPRWRTGTRLHRGFLQGCVPRSPVRPRFHGGYRGGREPLRGSPSAEVRGVVGADVGGRCSGDLQVQESLRIHRHLRASSER